MVIAMPFCIIIMSSFDERDEWIRQKSTKLPGLETPGTSLVECMCASVFAWVNLMLSVLLHCRVSKFLKRDSLIAILPTVSMCVHQQIAALLQINKKDNRIKIMDMQVLATVGCLP